MIRSLQKIEHVQPNGTTTLLLDFGDYIESEIEIGAEQQTTGFSPIGAAWGLATAEGGARRSFSFSRRLDHSSHSAVRSWTYSHPSMMPFGKDGVLRITIREADDAPEEIWELQSAVVQGCGSRPLFDKRPIFRSLTTYQITGGKMIPIQGNFGNCYPIDWQTYNIDEDETLIGDDECEFVPPYVPPEPTPWNPPNLVDDPEPYPWPEYIQIVGTGLDVANSSLNAILSSPLSRVSDDVNGLPRWSSDGSWSNTGGPRILVSAIYAGAPTGWYITGVDGLSSVNMNESHIALSPEIGTFADFGIFVDGGSGTPEIIIP